MMVLSQIKGCAVKDSREKRLFTFQFSRQSICYLIFAALSFSEAMAQQGAEEPVTRRFFSSTQLTADAAALAPFDVIVLPAECQLDKRAISPGKTILARCNPLRFPKNSAAHKLADKRGVATVARLNSDDVEVDPSAKGWVDFVADDFAALVLQRGFSGLLLDGLTDEPSTAAVIDLFRAKHPGKQLLIANPSSDLQTVIAKTDGIIFDAALASQSEIAPAVTAAIKSGKPVYCIEFAEDFAAAAALAKRVTDAGAFPFVTTREMSGLSLAPLPERSRRVLVLFGWDAKEAERPATWPIDTMTSELFQMPLEWLGYEVDYLEISKADPPRDAATRYAAVLFDSDLDIPAAKESDVANWLVRMKDRGLPVLFTGTFPFSTESAAKLVASAFGIKGSLLMEPRLASLSLGTVNEQMMNREAKAVAQNAMFHDLSAPPGAQVHLSLNGRTSDGRAVRYDPVFIAPWGGAWLEPYVVFRGSPDANLFYADPYQMLAAVLAKNGTMPAPDTTTRDGRRLFYSHIDGDGFVSQANLRGHPLCGELIRDRILKVFPFPVTVSVIEAEIRALAKNADAADEATSSKIARSIFELPNVHAASHSFSHPYQWDADDPNPGIYDEPNLPLKPEAGYATIDAEREIRGSIDYMRKNLLPPGKQIELMLWSGNCRPGTRALEVCRELGIENMNGGNTVISRLYPGIAGIAPRVMPWGDELQINAANQNEFMYTNGFNGPFFGGFADVIDTFERTETGRRVKPVNVYYHFYSATSMSSLRALEKIHHWCSEQKLHSVTALQFAKMARDAWSTRLYSNGKDRWLIANNGDVRTFRVPISLGRPDMARCKGVTGYIAHQDSYYVHTSGQPLTELTLTTTPESLDARHAHLRLASSSAEIDFARHDSHLAEFTVRDLRPVETEFAGLAPRADCDVTIDSKLTRMSADERGKLRLDLPATAHVTINASRSRDVSSR